MLILGQLFLCMANILAYIYCGQHWFSMFIAGLTLGLAIGMIQENYQEEEE